MGTCKYYITMHTGDKYGAGTDSDVRVQILGEGAYSRQNLTDKHLLDKSGYDDFERNDRDTYIISDRDVGNVEDAVISVSSSGWYLDSITIRKEGDPNYYWHASIHKWFEVSGTPVNDGELHVTGSLTKQFKMERICTIRPG